MEGSTPDSPDEIVAKVAVNIITEIFKSSFKALSSAEKWLVEKNKEYDVFGTAARRYARKLEERYDTIRIFGMDKPLPLRSIFVSLNILEKITGEQRLTIAELEKQFDKDRRSFGVRRETRQGSRAVDEIDKFIVLGKPGAGKTTFLKHTALRSLDGKFKKKRIPIFIGLKDFSDSDKPLLDFVVDQFDICNFPDAEPFIIRILENGQCQILLDGLDEVSKKKEDFVIRQIHDLSDKYSSNQFIISCRIAAYNQWFMKFYDIEVADFNETQIKVFINNWFADEAEIAELCWTKLSQDIQIKELASVPLLLTLLCLAFHESLEFPQNRAELYKEALDALLKKWDTSRRIKREGIYKNLSNKRKESLFSHIAAETFEKAEYFLPQRTLEKYIVSFIQHLPSSKHEFLEPDGEAVLKAVEAQHGIFVERAKGIYSFSHLTFQEYFTARYIVDNVTERALERLIGRHFNDERWREVILLTAGMLDRADKFFLLIEKEINQIIKEEKLKTLMESLETITKRATYYPEVFGKCLLLIYSLNEARRYYRYVDNLDEAREFRWHISALIRLLKYLNQTLLLESPSRIIGNKERAHVRDVKRTIQSLAKYDQDVNAHSGLGRAFDNNIDRVLNYFNVRSTNGLDVKEINLEKYLRANLLLVECLNADCFISKDLRERILHSVLSC